MKRSQVGNRRYVRTRRTLDTKAGTGRGALGRLADRAGLAARPSVEPLEPRQLLFSMNITPDDVNPNTGVGTVSTQFQYAIPYLFPGQQPPQASADTIVDEDFDGEPWVFANGGTLPRNIPNGRIFDGSNLVAFHNITPASDFQLVHDPNDPNNLQASKIRARIQGGESFSFRVSDLAGNPNGPYRGIRSMSMEISAPFGNSAGLDADKMKVTLLFQGQELASFTGDALRARNPNGTGIGTFTFAVPGNNAPLFDTIKIEAVSGDNNEPFFVDNVQFALPTPNTWITSIIFGASVTFSGPVGASVQFIDMQGDDMFALRSMLVPQNGTQPASDLNNDSVADFNNGIGRVVITGSDFRTSLTMVGGTADLQTFFKISDQFAGIFDDFEGAGFGYALTPDNPPRIVGLPPGPGSVIIGAPWLRDPNANPFGRAAPESAYNFSRADQGIFVEGGANMGTVNIHGVVHGSSRFSGAVDQINIGYLVGSITVEGDLGGLTVGSDAGLWANEVIADGLAVNTIVSTNSRLIVGRTAGEISVAGRSLLSATIVGNVNDPVNHPARDAYRYFEKEAPYGLPAGQTQADVLRAMLAATPGHAWDIVNSADGSVFGGSNFRTSTPGGMFGLGTFRNDTLMSAEWVGSSSTAVQIYGNLGRSDPVNTAEDPSDAYAFASDGSQPIVVTVERRTGGAASFRIIDISGRTVGAATIDELSQSEAQIRLNSTVPGMYYVVISEPTDTTAGNGDSYMITISGMASTTLGAYHTAGASGDFHAGASENFINVLSGSMGAVRVGTGFVAGGGMETSPEEVSNTGPNGVYDFQGTSISTAGTMYAIVAGGDAGMGALPGSGAVTDIQVGGDLGYLITGQGAANGIGPTQGDLGFFHLRVGGRIAAIDVRGAIGIDQDPDPVDMVLGPDSVQITTGTLGGSGDIGMIRVGAHIGGDTLRVTTSPGSVVGGFFVSQDIDYDPTSPFIGLYGGDLGAVFTSGAGSDVRFVDFPRIDLENAANAGLSLNGGALQTFVDDAGAQFTIQIVGGTGGGFVRFLPIDGSQGVAVASIDADLSGGGQLKIINLGNKNGTNNTVSIGKINITGATTDSLVLLQGAGEIDVWQIVQIGGDAMGRISNGTLGGDIVAIDVPGLFRLNIAGSLGRTQVPSWGPRLIGPFLGIAPGGAGGAAGDPMPVPAAGVLMDDDFNGMLYRPANASQYPPGQAFMDDIGGPVSPYLNGLVLRGQGDLTEAIIGGAIGDIVVTQGDIIAVTANSDKATAFGGFDGIVGVIYANNILSLNIGDGLARSEHSPVPTTGIFANDDIFVVAGTLPGSFISGTITAGNINATDRGGTLDGIESISLIGGGDFIDAYISTTKLEAFWTGIYDDTLQITGDINKIAGTGADFVRCEVHTGDLTTFVLTGGVYDASIINAAGSVGILEADAFRNSTLTGTDLEFHRNEIVVGGNVATLETTNAAGDMNDLRIDVLGSISTVLSALNFNRVQIEVDNAITLLDVVANFRASSINTGRLINGTVAGDVVSSRVSVSGPLEALTAANIINSRIEVTGPDGRIDLVTADGLFSGSVAASGPIGTLRSLGGDMVLAITTTTAAGNVTLLQAARDLDITADISGNLSELIAGRHIGNRAKPGVILVRGDLQGADASGGQLYSDLRIGGALIGAVTIGRANSKPGSTELGGGSIVAFGRINSVVVNGDFDGSVISYSGGIASVVINNGSFFSGNIIAAYNGDVSSLVINSGHLMGDVHADFVIGLIYLSGSADGVFGDIGINPNLSAVVGADDFRNQLPPGSTITVAVQGPTISAGSEINQITLANGSIFEATIYAGHAIGGINVSGDISNDPATTGTGTVIAAGDLVYSVNVGGSVSDAAILGGVVSFGSDGRAGGVGDAADTIKAGRVRLVAIGGNATNVAIAAGMTAGADGTYNTAGAQHALGLSYVQTVTIGGTVTNVTAYADSGKTDAPGGVVIGGRNAPVVGGVLEPVLIARDGNGVPIWSQLGTVLSDGVAFDFGAGTITYTGPGVVVWDAEGNRLLLLNTTLRTNVTVTSANGTLNNFDIVSNDDAMAGIIDIQADLTGDSDIIVDGYVGEIHAGHFSGTGSIIVGNDLQLLALASFSGGSASAVFVRQVNIAGDDSGTITITGSEGITIGGNLSGGVISLDRSLRGNLTVGGAISLSAFRAGGSVGSITAASVSRSVLSARVGIGGVSVAGDVSESSIVAGADLGRDARFGGEGVNADSVGVGSVGGVSVGGNFAKSDVIAGAVRGPDGFFGTSDDSIADGLSTIGDVTIGGTQVGSNLGSESYRVFATGSIGAVTLAGQPVSQVGNFKVEEGVTLPEVIRVTDIRVTQSSGIYTARIYFNQPMDASSIGPALGVFEVRGDSGEVTIRLIEGQDYTLAYEPDTNAARIIFNTAITSRNLPQVPGQPGPGVYRFTLDSALLRAAVVGARLDGNGDGFARGENFSDDSVVGDAGDKLQAEQIVLTNPDNGEVTNVDVYAPVNLNVVLDNNFSPDGVADANKVFTIRGAIGDHPDNDTNNFRFGSDVDVYKVTLQAGQILRLGASTGSVQLNTSPSSIAALFASFGSSIDNAVLYDSSGQAMGGANSNAPFLPAQGDDDSLAVTYGRNFLAKQTGDYFLVVSGSPGANGFFNQQGVLPNVAGDAGEVGDYAFTFEIFDDGNSGFAGATDSGNGENIPLPPDKGAFAGPDGQVGTGDDLTAIQNGSYTYTLSAQGDVVTTLHSAIGEPGFAGVPGSITPDIDVYHLNNGQAIAPGTRLRITMRLTDLGSDLGSRLDGRNGGGTIIPVRYAGQVQFGVFDTTNATGMSDGTLLFSPTDFAPSGGTPGTIASDGSTTYGYDAKGDFFVEFVAPGTVNGGAVAPAKYAVYIQGVFNTDYNLEVVTLGSGAVPAPQHQNVFLETNGGTIDWLQAAGLTTDLAAFDTRILGFTGTINGVGIDQYVLTRVVSSLNSVFAAAGLSVTVSANPADFEHQDFSTVFISDSVDPINFFNAGIFGYSQHSDILNADHTDEAVVFVQPMASLGYTPGQADIDRFSESLTAAVGRRVGELLGLRITQPQGPGAFVDIMASNSVQTTPDNGGVYQFSTVDRALSARFDAIDTTDFYLGNQNALSLLDRLLGQ